MRSPSGVHPLVAGNGAFALKFGRHDDGRPMAAIATDLQVLAGQTGGDDGLKIWGVMGKRKVEGKQWRKDAGIRRNQHNKTNKAGNQERIL